MDGLRTTEEERVVQAIRASADEIVAVVGDLISYDTSARMVGDPPRDEEQLQRFLGDRLRSIDADIDLWEPEATGTGNRHYPDNLDFHGRPQLAARLRGAGAGPSVLLNGHIDCVSVDTPDAWSTEPFRAVVRDGLVHGRGANDMKGGIAAMLVALEVLARESIVLAGDVVFCTVTDEESSGAGGWAAVAHGVSASAGICGEPTGLEVYTACRGTVCPTITVRGREGHAEMRQPHWAAGGAVNAIEKASIVLDAARRLRDEWRSRPDHQHSLLSPGDMVPTVISGGAWPVTYPSSCSIRFDCQYLPTHVDEEGTGWAVQREITDWIERAVATDPWLREHPIEWAWSNDVVPAEMSADHTLVQATLDAARALGRQSRIGGFDTWHDAATFTRHGTPTFSFGPSDLGTIHAVDERVLVSDLIDTAACVALALMRYCGVASGAS